MPFPPPFSLARQTQAISIPSIFADPFGEISRDFSSTFSTLRKLLLKMMLWCKHKQWTKCIHLQAHTVSGSLQGRNRPATCFASSVRLDKQNGKNEE